MLAKKLKKNGAAKEEAEANEGESYMFINKKKPAADKNNTNVRILVKLKICLGKMAVKNWKKMLWETTKS